MNIWLLQDAQARFSELLDACVLQRAARRSLKQLLLADSARTETLVPTRARECCRRMDRQFEVALLNPFEVGPKN